MPTDLEHAQLVAEAAIDASLACARGWFLSLERHPERYRFGTHAGFVFTQGSFGEPGARFQTRERFAGVPITLHFELGTVSDTAFRFRVLRPLPGVGGAFVLQETGSGRCSLTLMVQGESAVTRLLLGLPGLRHSVLAQIRREVSHIARSIARVCGSVA